MRILFLSLSDYKSINDSNIYTDLMREFVRNGNEVVLVSLFDKKTGERTRLYDENGSKLLRIGIKNFFDTNLVKKGISTLLIQNYIIRAIKSELSEVRFELIIYSTPPITFNRVVSFLKSRNISKTYLLLKDIFPQNAVDLGMFSKINPIYSYFRIQEKELYNLSDHIGCMSEYNVEYIRRNNPSIRHDKVEVCPNSITLRDNSIENQFWLREEYKIGIDSVIFLYGGNLGKPQGIDFLIKVLISNANKDDRFFVICGNGTEYKKIETLMLRDKPRNILLLKTLPKVQYDSLVDNCDIGMIFLDHKFTIPNYPSRILNYMEKSKPIIAFTDKATDLRKLILENDLGYWCESDDINQANITINQVINEKVNLLQKGLNSYNYLVNNFTSEHSYKIIMEHYKKDN
jgi:glycosyltransferase involved in cell wall biosynthesis